MPISSPFERDDSGTPASPDRAQRAPNAGQGGRPPAPAPAREADTDVGVLPLPPGAVVVQAEVPGRGGGLAEVVPLGRGPDAAGAGTAGEAAGEATGPGQADDVAAGWRARAGRAAADVVADARDTVRRAVTTPAVWSDRPPALGAVWDRLRRAPWCDPEVGLLVGLGRAYGLLALVVSAALYGVAWLTQRPGRLLVAAAAAAAAAWLA